MMNLLTLCLLATSASALTARQNASPSCREVTIPVSAVAILKVIPTTLDILGLGPDTNLGQLVNNFTDTQVTGQFNIAGRYCEPTKRVAARANTLQLLVHGITLDRNYWSGLPANNNTYSYVAQAAAAGYPTLAIDRICNGASTKPSATVFCQVPMDAAVQNEVIKAVRAGKVAGKSFSKVIHVAHSYGSLTANSLAQFFPDAVDALVLTAYSPFLLVGATGFLVSGGFKPAAVVDPVKYASLVSDPGYLIGTNRESLKGIFFRRGGFEDRIEDEQWRTRGTVPSGEFLTAPLGQLPAPSFKKPLFVANGQNEQIFCSRGLTGPIQGNNGDCGQGESSASNAVKTLFPNAKGFNWKQYPVASHFLNRHLSGPDATRGILGWLDSQGF